MSLLFLDTNIISYYFNGNQIVKTKFDKALQRNDEICTTLLNVFEIIKGLRWKENKLFEEKLNFFLKQIKILPFTNEMLESAACIYASLRRQGVSIGDTDIQIASIVINYNGILITNNTKHFENISNLTIENWA